MLGRKSDNETVNQPGTANQGSAKAEEQIADFNSGNAEDDLPF